MKYFKAVPNIGDLELEQILFQFDKTPMTFVCTDEIGRRYICQCTDVIINNSWIITKTSTDILTKLIKNEITIVEAFEKSSNKIITVDNKINYKELDFEQLSADELPDENERLDNSNLSEYIVNLQQK